MTGSYAMGGAQWLQHDSRRGKGCSVMATNEGGCATVVAQKLQTQQAACAMVASNDGYAQQVAVPWAVARP